jgi:hypothetical protein
MTRYAKYLILSASLAILTACSTTKLVPDDDKLFIGLKAIDYQNYEDNDHFTETQEELEAALATAPNGALFGSSYYRTPFPYGLWVWNYAYGSSGKFKKWLNKSFGKAPVLMSKVNPELRASVAKSLLHKNGYMHGDVTYYEVPQKNPKKMKIGYTVNLDTLFTVDTMTYVNFPPQMQALIDSTLSEARIVKGSPFSVGHLDAERSRLTQLFRNNGYFYYQTGYASYLADTFEISNRAKLRLQLADSLPQQALRPWYIGNVTMQMRRTSREEMTDSTGRNFLKVRYNGKRSPIRPAVILRNMKLRPRSAFSYDNYQESLQKINASGVFSSVDFQFTPRDNDTLDLLLNCTFDKPYDFYVETNVINRTIGRMGPELKAGVTRRNLFRGGEKIDINVHGNYEWQTSNAEENMNSYQYGADVSVEFPQIILPFYSERNIMRKRREKSGSGANLKPHFYSTPWTIAKVSTDIIRRPNYYKMHIVSGEWTYRWQPSETSRHEFSPLTVKYQFMNSHTAEFEDIVTRNPYLTMSLNDYFIPKMRYTYTFTSPSNKHNPIRWETTLEEAGNATALYDVVIQGNGWNQQGKTLFKNVYSQFVRLETDLTKTWNLDTKSQLVGHVNAGYIHSYGNTEEAPFSESFYVGGANSIRAFTVRSLGPGAFPGLGDDRQFSYMLRNGDIKLVMNLEYRRRLVSNLYGAIYLDAGNVWYRNSLHLEKEDYDDDEEFVNTINNLFAESTLKPSTFLKQIATGTGIGLRYDLEFLVLRVDWGFGLHLPYDTGKSGYFNIPRFKDMHSLHLAIGYPF